MADDQGTGDGPPKKPGGIAKWVVLGVLLVSLCCCCFTGGILSIASKALTSSDAYTGALSAARSNAEVVGLLGAPIQDGFMPSGSINVQNNTGNANMTIALTGSKGEGSLHLVATKSAGKWTYSTLTVTTASGEQVDLLASGAVEKDE